MSPAADAEEYLAALPQDQHEALQGLRQVIQAAAPEAVEAMSYGIPAFKYRGRPLVSFGAAKKHCAFYVMSPAVMDARQDELKDYDTSKGTIRFLPGAPLPQALVTELVKARIAETDNAVKPRSGAKA